MIGFDYLERAMEMKAIENDNDDTSVPAVVGEWMSLLKTLPGAAKAVAKLVGSLGSAGSAWIDVATAKGEQQSSRVRGTTKAQTRVREAMTKAALNQISSDPELGQRALEYFADKAISSQVNREEVTKLALTYLSEDLPSDTPEGEPSDDWLNVFSIYAERASSKIMREQWAALLAGEIRKPGAFSLRTMMMMSIMDQSSAELITRYTKYILHDRSGGALFCTTGAFGQAPIYDDLLKIDELGFWQIGTHFCKEKEYQIGDFVLRNKEKDGELPIQCGVLTTSGIEVLSIIQADVELEDAMYVGEQMIDSPFVSFELELFRRGKGVSGTEEDKIADISKAPVP